MLTKATPGRPIIQIVQPHEHFVGRSASGSASTRNRARAADPLDRARTRHRSAPRSLAPRVGGAPSTSSASRVVERPSKRITSPTAITSSGIVSNTPSGDANIAAIRTGARRSVAAIVRLPTRLVHALRRQFERGEKATFAARRIEPDARRSCPQIRRIVGRVRRQLVQQRARRRVPEHDELAAVVLEEVAVAQPQQRALRLDVRRDAGSDRRRA